MLGFIRSTDFKFKVACFIYNILVLFRFNPIRIIKRNGIFFEVDLSEGIDLALFLFGSFQKNVTQSPCFKIPDDAIIIDVGANIGSISLPLAHACRKGKVYAFEPTNYAFGKLNKNIQLNRELKDRIITIQSLVSSYSGDVGTTKIFSSWKLSQGDVVSHPVHHGIAMNAVGTQTSIDDFVKKRGLNRLDFIKIDTDGHELDVIIGAVDSITRFRPVIVFEVTTYLLEERGISFSEFEEIFTPLDYTLVDTKWGEELSHVNYQQYVPKGGSIDVAAIPRDACQQ